MTGVRAKFIFGVALYFYILTHKKHHQIRLCMW